MTEHRRNPRTEEYADVAVRISAAPHEMGIRSHIESNPQSDSWVTAVSNL